MKRIHLARNDDSAAFGSPPTRPIAADATMTVTSEREARQIWAIAWIVAAWLVGTFVFELKVVGAETEPARRIAEFPISHESMMQRWATRETEFAITHSGIGDFARIQRDQQLRQTIDAIIRNAEADVSATDGPSATENDVVAEADSYSEPNSVQLQNAEPQAEQKTQYATKSQYPPKGQCPAKVQTPFPTNPSVELAYQEFAARGEKANTPDPQRLEVAWKGFHEGTIPGLVELVIHSFNELMTPVHVRPLTSKQAVIAAADQPATAKGAVTFVETDTQEGAIAVVLPDQADAGKVAREQMPHRSVLAQRRPVASPPHHRPIVATRNPHHAAPLQQHAPEPVKRLTVLDIEEAQIVRSRPQLLRVPEQSVMLTAPNTEPAPGAESALSAESAPSAELAHGIDENVPSTETQPKTRLAAKWPFERNEPAEASGVSLNVDNADVRTVFEMLARGYQLNILVAPDVEGVVTANVEGLSPEQTLSGIVKMCGLSMQREEGMIYIYPADNIPSDSRQLRVFPLDFVRAATIEPTVQGLLSPVGNAYPSTLDSQDNLQTQESLVVVDLPSVIEQVESFILQADQAPRQVMIEARVLEVELSDDMMHGINFDLFARRLNLRIGSHGLADPIASSANPLFFAQLEGSELNGLLDFIETTTDSKTLASPRVQVINGQKARIQVGQQLGFTVATVTQTSTIQDVQFLETGVVLSVTPTISRDNRIMMQVKPEVSDGEINPDTLLPEEETREVETSVLLDDHQGVIIGGLIQEKDRTVIRKFPWLGDVKHIGKFFQRREAVRSRSEIIVALIPHIVDHGVQDERSLIDYERTETPLLHGVLQRTCRPWEPRLPDRAGEEKHMDVNRLNRKLP